MMRTLPRPLFRVPPSKSWLTIITIIGEMFCGATLFTAAFLSSCQSCQQGV